VKLSGKMTGFLFCEWEFTIKKAVPQYRTVQKAKKEGPICRRTSLNNYRLQPLISIHLADSFRLVWMAFFFRRWTSDCSGVM